MAGENNFNANKMPAVVYNSDGEKFETTRPNARELIATGNYFWSTEDIGKERIESDGPENPTAEKLTIYSTDGEALEVDRANAREMVATGHYTWAPAHAENADDASEEDVVAEDADAPVEEPTKAEEPKAEDPLDPLSSPLHEIAARVSGDPDIKKYLEGFSEENLRQMTDQRYGEKVHHRASKETIISKMIELEEAKLDAADAKDQASD